MERILVVEDKKSMAQMLRTTLESEGYECLLAFNGKEALRIISREQPDLIITDLKLPDTDGLTILKELRQQEQDTPVIIMTAFGTIEIAVEAIKEGAFDFVPKPFDMDHLLLIIKRALDTRRLYRENLLLREEMAFHKGMPEIVGKSAAISDVLEKVKKVAPTKTTVLLQGESGTGKELFARAIHYMSPRAKGLFVPINCAAIPRDLLESELFGYEKGAFTGATHRKLGKFELANNGTVFLDEISELEPSLQAKLLRVLQDQIIERIGGTTPIQVDVRVVAATNSDLLRAVKEGRFREDLFYRLNVFPIVIPPLRERKEDIPALTEFFIERFSKEMKIPPKKLSGDALKILMQYNWKGNVRELENTIERAMILADGNTILPEHISLMSIESISSVDDIPMDGPLEETTKAAIRRAESERIRRVLNETHWNKTKAAEILQISYKTLLTKIKEYNLE
ncbi:MAG: sigma-54-dependent Fis family transcriptional regulator [Nitrospirae bacterium]|nr:sigma-54-dependent Fis family transcriptional regulator [Nitrospirota bacterium]